MRKTNRTLYESIMRDVAKVVKKRLNESEEITVFVPAFGNCTVRYAFDPDRNGGNGDYYEVSDENGDWICDLPYNIDLTDEESIADQIEETLTDRNGGVSWEDYEKYFPDDVDDESDEDYLDI